MNEWKTVRLGDVATYINGYAFKPSDWTNEGLPIIRIQNLTGNDYETNYFNGELPEKYYIKNGDVLISWSASLGVYEWKKSDALLNQHIFKVVFNKLDVDKKYFMFTVSNLLNAMTKQTHGSTMRHITKPDFDNMEFPLPPLAEQKHIAAILDKTQKIIAEHKQMLQKYDTLIKSRFIEMFGDLDLSPQRNDWTELKDITTIFTGTTPSTTDEENWNGDILWITPAEMTSESFYIYDTERKITEKGQKSKSLSLMPANTVLLSTRAPIGKVGIAGAPMTCNQGFKNFYCKEDVLNPVYLYLLFKSNTEYLNSKGTGTTFKELSKSTVEKIKVPVPALSLQNDFAAFVQQIDKSKFEIWLYINMCVIIERRVFVYD